MTWLKQLLKLCETRKKEKKTTTTKKTKPVRSVCDQCETGLDATTRDDNVKHEKHV